MSQHSRTKMWSRQRILGNTGSIYVYTHYEMYRQLLSFGIDILIHANEIGKALIHDRSKTFVV